MVFIREKKIACGNYMEVDILPRTIEAENVARRGARRKKERVSAPKQRNLNEKNAKRYFLELGNGNFGWGDWHVTLTYSEEFEPATVDEAEHEVGNYIKRLKYKRKKLGIDPLKYILVSEYKVDDNGEFTTKIHHHLIMNGDESGALTRDDVEDVWSKRIKGKGKHPIGLVNSRRLQPNENGIEGLLKYLSKDPKGKKRWSASRNLKVPFKLPTNDTFYRKSKIEKLAMQPDQGREYFERRYKKFRISKIEFFYYERTGWHVYLKMWRI
ncbi:rolling circle replication-associated protein [Latilactobacillus sakei]|uniref:rolling circle replication-associated protein n=1 Tax=Latilactobacillus sakei TaxID=1599 RepID=UPI000977F0D9|nr:hypothetical protein [Latilactobacillus sakei]